MAKIEDLVQLKKWGTEFGRKILGANICANLHKEAQEAAKANGISLTQYVEIALYDALHKLEKPSKSSPQKDEIFI